jgi:hypothetical protein
MSRNKQARGLLDVFGDDSNTDSDLPESAVADLVLGLGLGATEQARQWALIGRALEAKLQNRRPAHRPKQDPVTHKDALRAFAVWQMYQNLRNLVGDPKAHITMRELIRVIRLVEDATAVPKRERMFPTGGNFEASVSRGKDILGIDGYWNSEFCEEVQRTFPKTTG